MKHTKLQLLGVTVRVLLGAAPVGFFIWGTWVCGGKIFETANYMRTIISIYNSNSTCCEIGSWLLSAYIILLPIFGLYYIYASIRRYNQS